MDKALEQAQKAFDAGEVPIGAVVINQEGIIIGAAYNRVEIQKTQTAHAELLALTIAAQKMGDWRLKGCTLYVTLEPCAMCLAAIELSRVQTIVFGSDSPLFGYSKKIDQFLKPAKMTVNVVSGIKQKECSDLLQKFFKQQRN